MNDMVIWITVIVANFAVLFSVFAVGLIYGCVIYKYVLRRELLRLKIRVIMAKGDTKEINQLLRKL